MIVRFNPRNVILPSLSLSLLTIPLSSEHCDVRHGRNGWFASIVLLIGKAMSSNELDNVLDNGLSRFCVG